MSKLVIINKFEGKFFVYFCCCFRSKFVKLFQLCWYATDEVLTKYELNDLVGLHCEAPEPPKPQPPPALSLLKFTKSSSSEQDLG